MQLNSLREGNMSKTKVKLDAICAKLKSMAQPGDPVQHEEEPLNTDQESAKSLSEACERDGDNVEKASSIPNGDVTSLEPETGGSDSIPSSRASTPPTQCNNNNLTAPLSNPPKILTGASRRKARRKVSRVDQKPSAIVNGGPGVEESDRDTGVYLSHGTNDGREDYANSNASMHDEHAQGEYSEYPSSMHLTNGYERAVSRSPSPPVEEESPQDLSMNRTVAHGAAYESRHYRRDSYDPLAIADFAERSYGQDEESDLLIDSESEERELKRSSEVLGQGCSSRDEKPTREQQPVRTEETYPTEPEDLSMPKRPRKAEDTKEGGEGSPPHHPSRDGKEGIPTNGNKGSVLYDTAAVREYAADTMKEFLGMYGYEDEQQRAERDDARLDNFAFGQLTQEHLKAFPRRPVDAFRARLEQEIRANPPKPEAGRPYDELQPQFMHMKLQRRTSSGKRKLGLHNGSQTFVKKMNQHIKGEKVAVSEEEHERSNRFSKYDYFIQKLEAGESISHDIPMARISKYDSYIHQLNQGNSIEKVIGKREVELQRPPDELSPRPRQPKQSSSPVGAQSKALGPRAHPVVSEFDPPMVTLAHSIFPGGSPYPILTSIPGMHPLPSLMAGPLGALNLSGRVELGLGPQSAALPGVQRLSGVEGQKGGPGSSEPAQSGLFKRSLLSGAVLERDEIGGEPGKEPIKGFSKYIARYAANENCTHCGFHYKEHFHCMEEECSFARFTRKEDVMRHYNWHRRRDDSLQHGFMRFSPSDDCSPHYPGCALNFRNTHYHCMQQGCNKVYTSTSDVLGHENFHKKNATLLNEGFQRYRATEDCGTPSCEFYGQKTTHFHCQRLGCNFVFKNKYDIERHKTFHTKDDIYKREGFKKFSKHESCNYESCPYSHMLNHFHCLRPGCNFVFTTANQMHSHKRKHERLERIIRYDRGTLDPQGALNPQHLAPGFPGTSSAGAVASHPLSLVKSEASILQNVLQSSPMVILKPGMSYQALNLAAAAGQVPLINTSMGPLPMMLPPPPPPLSLSGGEGMVVKSEPSSPEMSRPPPPYKEREYKGRDSPQYRELGASPPSSTSERHLPVGFAKIESKVGSRVTEGEELNGSLNLPVPSQISPPYGGDVAGGPSDDDGSADEGSRQQDEAWRKYLQRYTANDPCNSRCELLYKDHYHCLVDHCGQVFKSKENVKKHTRYHSMSEESSQLGFQFFPHGQSCEERFKGCVFSPLAHYHCMWSLKPDSFCGEVIHTGSPLMRPHFEKHMRNPTLARIHDLPEDPRRSPIVDRRSPVIEHRRSPVNEHRRSPLNNHTSPVSDRRSPPNDHESTLLQHRSPVNERSSPVDEHPRSAGDESHGLIPERRSPANELPPTTSSSPPIATIKPHSHSPIQVIQVERAEPLTDSKTGDDTKDTSPGPDRTPQQTVDLSRPSQPQEMPSMNPPPSDSSQPKDLSTSRDTPLPTPLPLPKVTSPKESAAIGYEPLGAGACTREGCPLAKALHYHCTKSECQYATGNMELMLDHKTNERLIFESFKQCSRKQDCRRPGCKYNLLHKHFHCMHQGCHFSFLQIQQMESHGRKHMRRIYGKLFNRPNSTSPGSGQQFVLPIMSLSRAESPPMMAAPPMVSPFYQSLMSAGGVIQGMPAAPPPLGSTSLAWSAIPQPTLVNVTGITPHTSIHNHQQLLLPITSLAGQPIPTDTLSPISAYGQYGEASSPISASAKASSPGRSPYSPPRKRPLTLVIEDPGAPSGYKRYKRGPLDSSMQEKFRRYERSEHCRDANCQYALNTTHYHCLHEGCDYRFAGKTMMYKHAQHHERVDSIVRDDFQRYKSTADCRRSDCEYGSKNTHFHCLRCPFICTDSGKVGVHRKQHSMSMVAERNGFKPYSSGEACPHNESCKYSRKYTHYHCDQCQQAVMGLQQMDTHTKSHQLDAAATLTSVAQAVA